jgi:Cys-rich protein (TIGR01571 family)
MTRTGLDWRGQPANRIVSGYSCANMTVLLSFWIAMNFSAFIMMRLSWERGYPLAAEYYVPLVAFNVLIWSYMACLTATVRGSIRNKYQIPDESCLGSEDCACAMLCMPCTICQMGRHTADFDTYRATCCTSTGLPRHVELAPVTFYDDQYENMNDEHQPQFPPRQEMSNFPPPSPHP